MGRKYNRTYKKGKFNKGSLKAKKADYGKTARKNLLENTAFNRKIWRQDPRKYDIIGIDTAGSQPRGFFKYKFRSKLKPGVKFGRENVRYRNYRYGERRGIKNLTRSNSMRKHIRRNLSKGKTFKQAFLSAGDRNRRAMRVHRR